jgi:predicted TPR repeat methyltransferase
MSEKNSLEAHEDSAADYDRLAREYHCFVPEALFGLCFDQVRPGERLLSIGIGTGLCAQPFAKAGLEVFGLDNSAGMLAVCRAKGIAADLREHDLLVTPWPYPDGFFDHVIASGVLHFLGELEPVFREAARVVRPGGLFAFTAKAPLPGSASGERGYTSEAIGGVEIFAHGRDYLEALLARDGFELLKDLEILVPAGGPDRRDPYFAFATLKATAPAARG